MAETTPTTPSAPASETSDARDKALAELRSGKGPVRFGVVNDHFYRGGQPTAHQLELLHALGVETVVNLRCGNVDEEATAVKRLGMHFLRFPFTGSFFVDSAFLAKAIKTIAGSGKIYVHCHVGRDRTSLIVALYRVIVEGWDPQRAWQAEAVAYGYKPGIFYRAILHSFEAMVRTLRNQPS